MTLQLDLEIHKEYVERTNVDRLQHIFSDKREPMFIADIVQRRLDVRNDPCLKSVYNVWWDNGFYTGDLWLRDSENKRGKIVCYSLEAIEFLKQIDAKLNLHSNNFLPLSSDFFEKVEGLGLTLQEIEKLNSKKEYTIAEALQSREWRYLLGNQERLEAYVEASAKESDNLTHNFMRLEFGKEVYKFANQSHIAAGKFWVLYDRICGLGANGANNLYLKSVARLVGVAPKMHVKREE